MGLCSGWGTACLLHLLKWVQVKSEVSGLKSWTLWSDPLGRVVRTIAYLGSPEPFALRAIVHLYRLLCTAIFRGRNVTFRALLASAYLSFVRAPVNAD